MPSKAQGIVYVPVSLNVSDNLLAVADQRRAASGVVPKGAVAAVVDVYDGADGGDEGENGGASFFLGFCVADEVEYCVCFRMFVYSPRLILWLGETILYYF